MPFLTIGRSWHPAADSTEQTGPLSEGALASELVLINSTGGTC